MKARVAKLWMKALRSDEYAQGQEVLARRNNVTDNVEYCCLGVLCELAIQDGVKVIKNTENPDEFQYDGAYTSPPPSVLEWAGIDPEPSFVAGDSFIDKCISWNDTSGYSFKKIASFVDRMKHDK